MGQSVEKVAETYRYKVLARHERLLAKHSSLSIWCNIMGLPGKHASNPLLSLWTIKQMALLHNLVRWTVTSYELTTCWWTHFALLHSLEADNLVIVVSDYYFFLTAAKYQLLNSSWVRREIRKGIAGARCFSATVLHSGWMLHENTCKVLQFYRRFATWRASKTHTF